MLAGIDEWLQSSEMQLALSAMDNWGEDDEAAEGSLEALLEETSERGFDLRALREQAFLGPGEPLPYSYGSGGIVDSCRAKDETAALALTVASEGLGRIAGALSEETATALRAHVLSELKLVNDMGARAAEGDQPLLNSGRLSKVLSPSAICDEEDDDDDDDDDDDERSVIAAGSPGTTRWDLQLRFRDEGDDPHGRCAVRQALLEVCTCLENRRHVEPLPPFPLFHSPPLSTFPFMTALSVIGRASTSRGSRVGAACGPGGL
jgi:hypothetical protein